MTSTWQQLLARHAGLLAGPFAWALNTQLGQILPYAECEVRLPLLAGSSFVLATASMAAAFVSWSSRIPPRQAAISETHVFTRNLSTLGGALFGFVLLLQGFSSLILTGCER